MTINWFLYGDDCHNDLTHFVLVLQERLGQGREGTPWDVPLPKEHSFNLITTYV